MNSSNGSSAASSSFNNTSDFAPSEIALQQQVRKALKSRIFLGRYVERRLVSEPVGYRDLVLLSPAEEELQRDLLEIRKSLLAFYTRSHWIGVTDTELLQGYKPAVCLWTEIDDKPFGPFWFQIKSVEFRWNEILVNLKCVRHITDRYLELEPFLVKSAKPEGGTSEVNMESLSESYNEVVTLLKTIMTLRNIKDGFVFAFALVIAVFTGSFSLVSYIGTFVLSMVRELSNLVHNSTPLFLGCLDFISKIIGGFYILLAMIFKQTSPSPSVSGRQIQYADRRNKRNDYYDHYSTDFD